MLFTIPFYNYPEYSPVENMCVLACKSNYYFDIVYRSGSKLFSITDGEEVRILCWADTECEALVKTENVNT